MSYDRIMFSIPCKAIPTVPELFDCLLKNGMFYDLYLDSKNGVYELNGDNYWTESAVHELLQILDSNRIPFDLKYKSFSEYEQGLKHKKYRLNEAINEVVVSTQLTDNEILMLIEKKLKDNSLSAVDKLSQIAKINEEGHLRHLESLLDWNNRIDITEYMQNISRFRVLEKLG